MTRTMNQYRSLAALLCATMLASCDAFEKNRVQELTAPAPTGARIRFFNFGVGAPGVNFYADNTKLTAILSATGIESTLGVAYGGVGAGGAYAQIAPGQHILTGRIAATTDKDLPISTVNATLDDGKRYSVYMSGLYDALAKTVDGFIVEDPFVAQLDYSVTYVRLVNAIFNANPLTLYATKTAPPDSGVVFAVGAPVAYRGAGAFTALPGGVYDLAVRYTDSTSNKIKRPGVSFLAGRVYTIGARGDITVAADSTCPTTSRTCLDNTANR
jgi:hypothetical protein